MTRWLRRTSVAATLAMMAMSFGQDAVVPANVEELNQKTSFGDFKLGSRVSDYVSYSLQKAPTRDRRLLGRIVPVDDYYCNLTATKLSYGKLPISTVKLNTLDGVVVAVSLFLDPVETKDEYPNREARDNLASLLLKKYGEQRNGVFADDLGHGIEDSPPSQRLIFGLARNAAETRVKDVQLTYTRSRKVGASNVATILLTSDKAARSAEQAWENGAGKVSLENLMDAESGLSVWSLVFVALDTAVALWLINLIVNAVLRRRSMDAIFPLAKRHGLTMSKNNVFCWRSRISVNGVHNERGVRIEERSGWLAMSRTCRLTVIPASNNGLTLSVRRRPFWGGKDGAATGVKSFDSKFIISSNQPEFVRAALQKDTLDMLTASDTGGLKSCWRCDAEGVSLTLSGGFYADGNTRSIDTQLAILSGLARMAELF